MCAPNGSSLKTSKVDHLVALKHKSGNYPSLRDNHLGATTVPQKCCQFRSMLRHFKNICNNSDLKAVQEEKLLGQRGYPFYVSWKSIKNVEVEVFNKKSRLAE